MNELKDERIETLKEILRSVVNAHLEFAGYRKKDGEYVPGAVQNPDLDPAMAQRMLSLGAALDPLRAQIEQL
jgi:hypothetical protein